MIERSLIESTQPKGPCKAIQEGEVPGSPLHISDGGYVDFEGGHVSEKQLVEGTKMGPL